MSRAYFSFHGRLQDFLPRESREGELRVRFQGRQSVKHLAESLGTPHPEIGRIQVNGRDEALGYITQDEDRVDVYPIEDGCPVPPRFILDCHLGRLAAHLRMLGLDCLYERDYDDPTLAEIAAMESRILLTRDRRLLMRKEIQYGYCPRSLDAYGQLLEVVRRFELMEHVQPFHRCLHCNHPLEPVEKSQIIDRLEPLTKKYFDEFHICPACGQIYWKGSHFERMQELIRGLTNR